MKKCNIQYYRVQGKTVYDKLEWLTYHNSQKFNEIHFEHVIPDKNNNWINLTDNDWESIVPIADKNVKLGRSGNAIFELFSLGVVTNRDDWVYDFNLRNLENKVNYLIDFYNSEAKRLKNFEKSKIKDNLDYKIKWTRAVKNDLSKGKEYAFNNDRIIESFYRPFVKNKLYFSKELNEMQYQLPFIFGKPYNKVKYIITSSARRSEYFVLSNNIIPSLDVFIPDATTCLPLFRYTENGEQIDNITDWGLEQFRNRYENNAFPNPEPQTPNPITKEDIFHYVYGVLHNPEYRKKYELNLKREFPRIPFYDDFRQWAEWGKKLMDLHINFETVEEYPLEQIDLPWGKDRTPIAKLRADKEYGIITLDEQTSLTGIPKEAWEYKLGNRSALEWILDQYKEKTPKDPTIREKFNTYKFAGYKDKVIDLIKRVTTVSVETMKIIKEMEIN